MIQTLLCVSLSRAPLTGAIQVKTMKNCMTAEETEFRLAACTVCKKSLL